MECIIRLYCNVGYRNANISRKYDFFIFLRVASEKGVVTMFKPSFSKNFRRRCKSSENSFSSVKIECSNMTVATVLIEHSEIIQNKPDEND